MADSFMYKDYAGFGNCSASLKGRETHINPTRIYSQCSITLEHVTETGVKWWQLRKYLETWGESAAPIYVDVVPGYIYLWNTEDSTFTVTDDLGVATVYANIKQLCDFKASWGVISSNQFSVKYIAILDEDIVMIGERPDTVRDLYTEVAGQLMHQDYLTEGTQHILFNRLVSHITTNEVSNLDFSYVDDSIDRSVLLTATEGLQASNNYPIDLLDCSKDLPAERSENTLQCAHIDEISYLMIAFFANNLLTAHPKVLFEPWMLWDTFRWFYNGTHASANNRQIFDLSPRWG